MSRKNDKVKADVEEHWKKAINFIPSLKELIIYEPDEKISYYRVKIGDGITNVNLLPFVTCDEPLWNEF